MGGWNIGSFTALIFVTVCSQLCMSQYHCSSSTFFTRDKTNNTILTSYMQVEITISCGSARLMCYDKGKGEHNFDVRGSQHYSCTWDFTRNAATKFWCQAFWYTETGETAATMSEFAVFGGDVEAKSQHWKIDQNYRYQWKVDGSETNLYAAYWEPKKIDNNF